MSLQRVKEFAVDHGSKIFLERGDRMKAINDLKTLADAGFGFRRLVGEPEIALPFKDGA